MARSKAIAEAGQMLVSILEEQMGDVVTEESDLPFKIVGAFTVA